MSKIEDVRLSSDRHLAMVGLALMLVPALWFVRSDFQLYAQDWVMLRGRLMTRAFLAAVPLAGLVLFARVRERRAYDLLAHRLAWAMVVAVLLLTSLRPVGSGLPFRTPFLNIAFLLFALPATPLAQLAPAYVLSLGLIALRLTRLRGGDADPGGDVVVMLVLNALGTLVVWRRSRRDAATEAVVGELRQLREIIPICSHCRKLKTDLGDWQQLEQYFATNTDTLFSHGICPDCVPLVRRRAGLPERPPAR